MSQHKRGNMKEEILRLLGQGLKQYEVADALLVSKQYVHVIAKKAGLALTRAELKKDRDAAKREKASLAGALLEEGKTYKEVADALGIRTTEVKKLLGISSPLGHGGERPGCGRIPNPERKIRVGISLTPTTHKALVEMGNGNASRGVAIAVQRVKGRET